MSIRLRDNIVANYAYWIAVYLGWIDPMSLI